MAGSKLDIKQVAKNTPFDNSSNGFTSTTVQGAIEEIGASASPGFSWGRSGSIGSGTWLLNESVPSNNTGRYVSISNPVLYEIFASNEGVNTFTISIYEHSGNSIGLTLLDTLTVTSARGGSKTSSVSVTQGKQIAVRLTSGSAKNIVVGTIIKGSV